MTRLTIIAGARPNFMKIAPIIHAIDMEINQGKSLKYRLVHTGQHYDKKMSGDFFEQLQIPEPHANLESGGGTQAEQTAAIMIKFEQELIANPADIVIVVGDVTSTMACAIVAQKLQTKVAHVEGGIRSYDWSMPEEINRLVTDSITNYFFTTSKIANENLLRSGVKQEQIYFVGNTMIDTLLKQESNFTQPELWLKFKLKNRNYLVMTIHRPANVDNSPKLLELLSEIRNHSNNLPIIFPVHPRTQKILKQLNFEFQNIHPVDPMSYLEFNYLIKYSKAVITDSGGITEETTVLGIPCITIRDNTERPETITQGTNELIGTNPKAIKPALQKLFSGNWKSGTIPELWDGKAGERIVSVIKSLTLNGN